MSHLLSFWKFRTQTNKHTEQTDRMSHIDKIIVKNWLNVFSYPFFSKYFCLMPELEFINILKLLHNVLVNRDIILRFDGNKSSQSQESWNSCGIQDGTFLKDEMHMPVPISTSFFDSNLKIAPSILINSNICQFCFLQSFFSLVKLCYFSQFSPFT